MSPRRYTSKSLITGVALCCAMLLPDVAWAQRDAECDNIGCLQADLYYFSISLTLGALATLAPPATTLYLLSRSGPALPNKTALRTYILSEREALLAAHALGSGDGLDDLAILLDVPRAQRRRLGASMRQERVALNAVLAKPCADAASCDALADRSISILLDSVHAPNTTRRAQ
jgi:hypothetical protein